MREMTTQQQRQQQQQQQAMYLEQASQAKPRRRDIFLHGGKTLKLIGALMRDVRIAPWRKILFVGSIAGLLVLLLFPDALNEAFLSVVMPFVGTVLGVPLDAGFDWIAFALVVVNLLRFFPKELVAEHYGRIFSKDFPRV